MIGSVHNFAHDTTAELSYHVQICELIAPFNSNFSQDMDYEFIIASWNGPQITGLHTKRSNDAILHTC